MLETIAAELAAAACPPERIESVSIDMAPAFIKGCTEHRPNARITFDKFHVIGHANAAMDKVRLIQQRADKSTKGCAGRCSRTAPPSSQRLPPTSMR